MREFINIIELNEEDLSADPQMEYIYNERKRYKELDDIRKSFTPEEQVDDYTNKNTQYRIKANEIGLHPLSKEDIQNRFKELDVMEKESLERIKKYGIGNFS